jgi:hypothetical protein
MDIIKGVIDKVASSPCVSTWVPGFAFEPNLGPKAKYLT